MAKTKREYNRDRNKNRSRDKYDPKKTYKRTITLLWEKDGVLNSKVCELDQGEVLHVHDAIDKDDPNHDVYLIT